MASLFRRDPRTKITSLFRELFSEIVAKAPDEPLIVAITAAAELAGMEDYDMEGIANRLLEISQKAYDRSQQKKPRGGRKEGSGFGDGFTKWVGGLNADRLCLWLADYDFDRAEYLFREVDIDDLTVMVDLKTGQTWEAMKAHFEACVLGAGGKLKGQDDATVHEVDMSDTDSINDMVAQMKALGF